MTGANSLLGTNLIHTLLDQGYFVKGLVRDASKYEGIRHQNLELTEAGLFDDLTAHLQGCDSVIHVAAETGQNLLRYSDYQKINYHATARLFDASINCNIKRFLFVSTANTLGFGTMTDPGCEQMQMKWPFSRSDYVKSKMEAEDYLIRNKHKIDVVILHPTFMIGAYDTKPSSGKIILFGLKTRIIFYPPGGKNIVHVKDVAEGILQSMVKGANGKHYLLCNENLTYAAFFKKLDQIAHHSSIRIRIPKPVLLTVGYFGDLLRFFKVKTNVSSVNMRILCVNNFYSNAKSVKELGMQYRPIEQAVRDAISYFGKKRSNFKFRV